MTEGERSRTRLLPAQLRLTTAGWLFLAIAVLVGIAAVKSQAPLMYVLFGVMMGALMASATLASRMISAVGLRRDVPTRTWQNQTVHLGYYLRNGRRRTACLGLSVHELAPQGIDSIAGFCVYLPARRTFRAGARFTPRRRGRILLQGVKVSTTFPFGLVEGVRRIEQTTSLLVWPARGNLTRRLLRRGAVETSTAPPSPNSGGQDEFFGLREYRPGDNPRWIHWKRTATRKAPVLREMARPLPEALWVVVDTFWRDLSDVGTRSRERSLRFVATLIDHAFVRGYQVGMAISFADGPRVTEPDSGKGQRRELLDQLAQVDANTSHEVVETLRAVNRKQFRRTQVILVLSKDTDIPSGAISHLRAAASHLTVVHADHLDKVFNDDLLEAEANHAAS